MRFGANRVFAGAAIHMTILDFLALGLSLTAIAVIAVYTLITGAPPMPSGRRARRAAVDLLAGRRDIAELGAGWGGLAVAAARHWPAARVTAYERSLLPVFCLWLRQKLVGPDNLQVVWGDFLRSDLTGHDGFLCFLNREVMVRLRPELTVSAINVSFNKVSGSFCMVMILAFPGANKSVCYSHSYFCKSRSRLNEINKP